MQVLVSTRASIGERLKVYSRALLTHCMEGKKGLSEMLVAGGGGQHVPKKVLSVLINGSISLGIFCAV